MRAIMFVSRNFFFTALDHSNLFLTKKENIRKKEWTEFGEIDYKACAYSRGYGWEKNFFLWADYFSFFTKVMLNIKSFLASESEDIEMTRLYYHTFVAGRLK